MLQSLIILHLDIIDVLNICILLYEKDYLASIAC